MVLFYFGGHSQFLTHFFPLCFKLCPGIQIGNVLITTLFYIPENKRMLIILACVLYVSVVCLRNGYLDIFLQYFSP